MGSRILRFEGRLWRAELPRRHDNVRGSQKLCHSCTARLRHGSRTNGSYNDTKVVTIYLSTRQEPLQSVVLKAQACGRIEGSARISRHSVGVCFSDACCERLLSSSIEERTKVRSRRSDAFIRTNGPTYEEKNPSPCLSLLERERQNHPAAAAKQIFCRLARKENRHGTCRYAR